MAPGAPPPPTATVPPFAIYSRIVLANGYPTIVFSLMNRSAAPARVCTSDRHCLRLEVKDAAGAWITPTAWRGAPADPGLGAADFVTIPALDARDVMQLPLASAGKPRAFRIGAAGQIDALPSHTQYRFEYRLDPIATTAAAKLVGVVAGPLGPSNGPLDLVTLDPAEIVAGIATEPNAADHVKPGDDAILPLLDPIAIQRDYASASSAIRAMTNVGDPAAVAHLITALDAQPNGQLRNEIARGLAKLAPLAGASVLGALLAREPDPNLAGTLARGLGSTDDRTALPALVAGRARVDQAVDRENPTRAETYPFDLAAARLGDRSAIARLTQYLRTQGTDLDDQFRELAFTQSLAIARVLVGFFRDYARGTRIAPYRDGPAPTTAAQRQAAATLEAQAYVRIADTALFAVLQMVPARAAGVVDAPLRRYTQAEFAAVTAAIKK